MARGETPWTSRSPLRSAPSSPPISKTLQLLQVCGRLYTTTQLATSRPSCSRRTWVNSKMFASRHNLSSVTDLHENAFPNSALRVLSLSRPLAIARSGMSNAPKTDLITSDTNTSNATNTARRTVDRLLLAPSFVEFVPLLISLSIPSSGFFFSLARSPSLAQACQDREERLLSAFFSSFLGVLSVKAREQTGLCLPQR